MKKKIGKTETTRARGKSTRYAPITPDIAPEAPTSGVSSPGLESTKAAVAATPDAR